MSRISPTDNAKSKQREQLAERDPAGYYLPGDEIDLFELMSSLWSRRLLVAGVTLLFTFAGALYALMVADELYEAEVRATPITTLALSPLNDAIRSTAPALDSLPNEGDSESILTADMVLGLVVDAANSQAAEQKLLDTLDATPPAGEGATDNRASTHSLTGSISITPTGPSETEPYVSRELVISVQHQNPEDAAKVANALMAIAHDQAKALLLEDLKSALKGRLAAERQALAQASADATEFHTPRIARIQSYLDLDFATTQLVRINHAAIPPGSPIKPRRGLIIAASTVFGGMLAVLLALVLNAAEARRKTKINEA